MAQIAREHRAVQRAYHFYIQRRRLLEHGLHLHTVFAHYAHIIAPCFAVPFLILAVQRAELSEGVCREQRLICFVIAHHYLGPVYHGSE